MVRQEKGIVTPLITEGRAPGPGEVALGAVTMRDEGLHIGDDLEIKDAIAGNASFRITGVVVLNVAGVDVSIPPGHGALFDWSMLARLNQPVAEFIAPQIFLVDVQPGHLDAVSQQLATLFPTSTRSAPVEPLDLVNLGDASLLPAALGVVVAVLGIGTVAHAMLSTVRRRQRELGVLKTLGFVRSDVRRTIAWQAVTFGAIALVVGIPLGVIGGRLAWYLAAEQLGIPSHPVVATASIALVAAAVGAVLLLTAAVPAHRASHVRPADMLRRD
jgi:predicted lysophospholipase L1 biosynthesis ABC-type transport system permease subunit